MWRLKGTHNRSVISAVIYANLGFQFPGLRIQFPGDVANKSQVSNNVAHAAARHGATSSNQHLQIREAFPGDLEVEGK